MSIDNIDDVLAGLGAASNTTQPQTPEHKDTTQPDEDVPHETSDSLEVDAHEANDELSGISGQLDDKQAEKNVAEEPSQPSQPSPELDDYGNEKPPPKTYSEAEVSERINAAIRERLARLERNSPQQEQNYAPQNTQNTQAPQGQGEPDWRAELETFIAQTNAKQANLQRQQQAHAREAQAQVELQLKFDQGMARFPDFAQVVRSQPISDDMVRASREMADPAAFFYTAAKKAPTELARISAIADPYSQVAELTRLEMKLRQPKHQSKTPRPLGKVQEDATMPVKKPKAQGIDDLIAEDTARRLALRSQRGRRR